MLCKKDFYSCGSTFCSHFAWMDDLFGTKLNLVGRGDYSDYYSVNSL